MSEIIKPGLQNVTISKVPLGPEAILKRLPEVGNLYREARTVFPWNEISLDFDEACEYIASLTQHDGFGAFMAESSEGQILGARLHELITVDQLEDERGPTLREFIQTLLAPSDEISVVWTRETFVSPCYQRQGLATSLGRAALTYMTDQCNESLVLCRVRNDNLGSIKGVERVGYKRSGVSQPHSTLQGVEHEY